MTLPLSRLVVDVLAGLKISPGQLMPFTWRTLACLDAIEAKHNLGIDVEVVKHSYILKNFSGCRIEFVNKRKDEPLILNNDTVNERGWKKDYFFVDKFLLGDEANYLLDHWNAGGKS